MLVWVSQLSLQQQQWLSVHYQHGAIAILFAQPVHYQPPDMVALVGFVNECVVYASLG